MLKSVGNSPTARWHVQRWAPGLALIVVSVGLAGPFWNVLPLSRDQGVYATCSQVLLQGGAPFRDCWDTKGPALHYTYALAWLFFGHVSHSPYILSTLFAAATAIALAFLARAWFSREWWTYGLGLLYSTLAIAIRFDMNAQPENFANLFTVIGLLCLTYGHATGRRWLYFASGSVFVIAALYKYALLLPIGMAALVVLLGAPGGERSLARRERAAAFGLAMAGATGVLLLFGFYLATRGALGDAIDHVHFIFLDFPRAQLNPNEAALRYRPVYQTLLYFGRLPMVFGLAFAGGALSIWRRRWYGIPLALYILAGIVIVWAQQRFTPYHWTASLPALVLAIGALIREIVEWRARYSKFHAGYILIGLSVALLVNAGWFFYVDQWLILGPYLTGAVDEKTFYESQGVWDQMVVAQYIREHTEPEDKIWVWGHHAAIYFLADRQSPTRFIYNEPLLMHIDPNLWQAGWRAEALNAIYDSPPTYLLLTTFDRTFFDFQNPNDAWRDIPEYQTFTELYYFKEYEVGRFQVFRLVPWWGRQNSAELLDAVTIYDLLKMLDDAQITAPPGEPVRVMSFVVNSEAAYDTLLMHPEAQVNYTLDLPNEPVCLRFDVAMFPDSWNWGGDGATFVLEIEANGATSTLFEQHVSLAPNDQRWHPHLIDLSQYIGQHVVLSFRTTPGPAADFTGDWAGWAMPRIVQLPERACERTAIIDLR